MAASRPPATVMALFRSIRSKILVGSVSLLVVMTVAVTVVATQHTQTALRSQIEETHKAQAERVAADLDAIVLDAKRLADAVARSSTFSSPVPEANRTDDGAVPEQDMGGRRALLSEVLSHTHLVGAAILVDAGGKIVLGEPYDAQRREVAYQGSEPAVDRYEVLASLAAPDAGEAEPGPRKGPFIQRGETAGSWVVVAPVHDDVGEAPDTPYLGVLVFEGGSAPLLEFVRDPDRSGDQSVFIVDDQGIVVAGPSGFPAGRSLQKESATLASATGGTGVVTLGGRDHLASLFPLSSTDWDLLLATDEEVAFAAIGKIVRTTVVLGGLALVFGILMSLVLAQDLAVPIRRLQEAAKRVTAGEYGTQVRVSTHDELSDLAGAFNAMSARLQEENQRLLRYQESLEETVGERTRELWEKNDELEAFVYAASHDLRTPIISLDWLAQELGDQISHTDVPPEIRRTLDRIRANIEGMDRLVNDLLELSRIGRTEGEPAPVPLGELVQSVVDELAPRLAERHATVSVEAASLPVVMADRRRMHQVFANLIGNGLKYGRDTGGVIRVRATPIGNPERPWKWRIEVIDNGPGVPQEYRERIFLLFQRAPDPLGRPIEGTGVGLAIVRKIVRAYGGDIQVTDAQGGGALFWFTLPAPRAPKAQPRGGVPVGSDLWSEPPPNVSPGGRARQANAPTSVEGTPNAGVEAQGGVS